MIGGLIWLLACQLAGTALAEALDLPVPGPVVGMVLLFAVLTLRRGAGQIERAADVLLKHLQLLFIPAGVGVVAYLGTLRDHAVPIVVALVGSWLLGLAVVGLTVKLLERGERG